MHPIKFNDWSELGLKKDIEIITKKLDSREPIFLSVCIEIVIAMGTILIDHFFDDGIKSAPKWVWITVIVGAILPPFAIVTWNIYKFVRRVITAAKGNYNINHYVDTFDNSICYWAMMSSSFASLLKDSTISMKEKVFIYQEAHYYANKSILKLHDMVPLANKIFSDKQDKFTHKHTIAIERLEIVIALLKEAKSNAEEDMKKVAEESTDLTDTVTNCMSKQQVLNKEYDEMANNFLERINEYFSCNLIW